MEFVVRHLAKTLHCKSKLTVAFYRMARLKLFKSQYMAPDSH